MPCAEEMLGSHIVILLVLALLSLARADHKVIFSPDYSLHERPPTADGQPVVIEASINLRNILDVAEKEQIISLETTLRLYWKVGIAFLQFGKLSLSHLFHVISREAVKFLINS